MPRDLFRLLFQEKAAAWEWKLTGELVSRPKLLTYGTNLVQMLVADVLVSGVIVSALPLAQNATEALYAQPGMAVELERSATGRLEIVGLSKRGVGNVYQFTLTVSTGILTSGAVIGYSTRTATLADLASAMPGSAADFGATPLEATLLMDADGSIVNVVL